MRIDSQPHLASNPRRGACGALPGSDGPTCGDVALASNPWTKHMGVVCAFFVVAVWGWL